MVEFQDVSLELSVDMCQLLVVSYQLISKFIILNYIYHVPSKTTGYYTVAMDTLIK